MKKLHKLVIPALLAVLSMFALLPGVAVNAAIAGQSEAAAFCKRLPEGSASTAHGYCAFTAPGATTPCVVSSSGSFPSFGPTCQTRQLKDFIGQDEDELLREIMQQGGTAAQPGQVSGPVGGTGGVATSGQSAIDKYLATLVNILVAAAGLATVGSMIFAGIQYMTARDNAGQVSSAKNRMVVSVVCILLLGFGYTLLQWLIPGGVFSN